MPRPLDAAEPFIREGIDMKLKALLCVAFFLVSCSRATPHQLTAAPLPSVEIATYTSTTSAISPTGEDTVGLTPESRPSEEATLAAPQATTPEVILTMAATRPAIEVTFDGTQCTTNDSPVLTLGEHLISFNNLSEQTAYMFLFRNYPGKTWQDALLSIGTPGSDSEIPDWIAMVPYDHSMTLDSHLTYQQFTFRIEGLYGIVVETRTVSEGTWPCRPFTVAAHP